MSLSITPVNLTFNLSVKQTFIFLSDCVLIEVDIWIVLHLHEGVICYSLTDYRIVPDFWYFLNTNILLEFSLLTKQLCLPPVREKHYDALDNSSL